MQDLNNLDDLKDEEVVSLILERDKELFGEVVGRYQNRIFAYCLRLLNFNRQDAEDVTGETFLKVFINLAGFNPSLKFSSWIYRIAHNEAVNLIKKKSKFYTVQMEKLETIPEEIDFEKPRKDDLEKILNRLNLDDKNLLTLFYLEERSLKEISEILKITENNVAVKLNRARNKAKKLT